MEIVRVLVYTSRFVKIQDFEPFCREFSTPSHED